MPTRVERLIRIYDATEFIYRFQMRRVGLLDTKLKELARIEAEELGYSISIVPYHLLTSRLSFLRIERLKLVEERTVNIPRQSRGL